MPLVRLSQSRFVGQQGLVLLVLSSLSGASGLAYELLYVRLFSNYFGDGFLVAGMTLFAVFMGLSLGAWHSKRLVGSLAWIELTLGLYALVAATLFSQFGFQIASYGNEPWMVMGKLALLLGVPAFLIGTCIPLFHQLLQSTGHTGTRVFARVYGVYNLGAFLSVLMIEFFLFRLLGLQVTIYLIAGLNLLVGVALLVLGKPIQVAVDTVRTKTSNSRLLLALFIASFASGIFQLFALRLSFSVFGPLNENFAILLGTAILGVALGAVVSTRTKVDVASILWLAAVLMLSFLVFVPLFVALWSGFSARDLSDTQEVLAKLILLSGFCLPIFVVLGTLVPLTLRQMGTDVEQGSGHTLAISSLGNGLGALAMFLVVYRYLSLPQIGVLLAVLLSLAAMIAMSERPKGSQGLIKGVIAISLIFAAFHGWPKVELLLGYRFLTKPDHLAERLQSFERAETYKAYDQNASIVSFRDGSKSLVFNGYHSLSFGPQSKSELHEVIVGATPALFSGGTDRAMVLGLGTGISAGSTARIYNHTRVVEINPAMFDIARHFEAQNHRVLSKSNVEAVLEDGIVSLVNNTQQYDAIINTVTSPRYYSASKLYTTDFLELVKARLSKGGVYSGWFDISIDADGISIMLNTLESSFEHCRYFLLNASYFNAVCADSPLTYLSSSKARARVLSTGIDPLVARFGFAQDFVDTLGALEVQFDAAFFNRVSDEINTLDRPVIEFVVARPQDRERTADLLADTLLANLEFQRRSALGRSDWHKNCQAIARMSQIQFSGC